MLTRVSRALATAVGVLALGLATAGPASAHDGGGHHQPDYYVSLGDSLAAGYQPDVRKDTDVSYTDQLYARLKQSDPDLVHIKLGCSGETTGTLIDGGICSYPGRPPNSTPPYSSCASTAATSGTSRWTSAPTTWTTAWPPAASTSPAPSRAWRRSRRTCRRSPGPCAGPAAAPRTRA
ncbi:hypothetical protein ACFQZC_15970 [Streptacidiphilus monticola]